MRIAVCPVCDLAGVIALNTLRPLMHRYQMDFMLLDDTYPPSLKEIEYFLSELPRKTFFPLIERRKHINTEQLMTVSELQQHYDIKVRIFIRQQWESVALELASLPPELMFLVRFPIVLKEPLLSRVSMGVYNVHSGHVPSYRGLLAPFRAMLNGEKIAGCTLHRVDAGIDTGPIVGARDFVINHDRSFIWNACNIYPLGVSMFIELLSRLETAGTIDLTPQSSDGSRYYRLPTRAEIAAFHRGGFQFVKLDDYLSLLSRFTGDLPNDQIRQGGNQAP